MANEADITAQADINLQDFEAGLKKMESLLAQAEDKASKREEKAEKKDAERRKDQSEREVKRETERLKKEEDKRNKIRIAATIAAGAQLVRALAEGGAQASELTRTLSSMDKSLFADSFTKIDQFKRGLMDVGGAFLGIVESVPIIGPAIGELVSAGAKNKKDMRDISVEINRQVVGYDELIAQNLKLDQMRAKEREKSLRDPEQREQIEKDINKAQADNAEQFSKNADAEIAALTDQQKAAEKIAALNKIDLETAQKKAALENSLKNPGGGMSKVNVQILAKGVELIEAQAAAQKRSIEYGKIEEEEQIQLNKYAADRGITTQDQLDAERQLQSSLAKQLETAKQLYGVNSLIYTSLQAQRQESELKYDQILFDQKQAMNQAAQQVAIQAADLTGNKKIAAEMKARLQFASEIAKQERLGNKELVMALKSQQALAVLNARVADKLKTPSERRKERQEQRKLDRATRAVDAQDRVRAENRERGATGQRSSRDYVSPSAQRAAENFVKRNGGDLAAAKAAAVATMTVQTLTVQTIEPKK